MYDLSIAESAYFIATFKKGLVLIKILSNFIVIKIHIQLLCQSCKGVVLQNTLHSCGSHVWY